MKRIVLTIAALVVASLSFAQEYLVVENKAGGFSRFDVDMITKASFKSFAAEGQGTEASPFNVAAANQKCKEIGETPSTEKYYIKGTLLGLYRSYDTSVASFYIADDESGINRIFVNEVGTPIPVTDMKAGDEIIIYGSLYSYNNLTPEIIPQQIVSYNGVKYELIDAQGTGTFDDPFNVAAAIQKCKEVGQTASTEKYFIKGTVAATVTLSDTEAAYGNISFNLIDAGNPNVTFYCYRVFGSDGAKLPAGYTLNQGDEVLIYSSILNYAGRTPETSTGGQIYAHNGKRTDGGDVVPPVDPDQPSGTGTESDPFNVAAAIAKCVEVGETASNESYYIKGIADTEYTVNAYNNLTVNLVDKAGSDQRFTVYRIKDKDGKGIKEGYKINKGDVIVVYGPVVNYRSNTPETATGAYLVSVNGQAPEVNP